MHHWVLYKCSADCVRPREIIVGKEYMYELRYKKCNF